MAVFDYGSKNGSQIKSLRAEQSKVKGYVVFNEGDIYKYNVICKIYHIKF